MNKNLINNSDLLLSYQNMDLNSTEHNLIKDELKETIFKIRQIKKDFGDLIVLGTKPDLNILFKKVYNKSIENNLNIELNFENILMNYYKNVEIFIDKLEKGGNESK